MRRTVLIMSFVLCSISLVHAQKLSPYLCNDNLYPAAVADSPVLFPYVTLTGTTLGSDGVLTILNKSKINIRYYLIVMEFIDAKGKYLFSAPVYNVDRDRQIPFDVPYKPWLLANWPGGKMKPIPARSKSGETFGTQLVSLTCPASVRISVIWLKYEDANEFKYVSEDLNLSASIRGEPRRINDLKSAKGWAPLTVSGNIELDSQGRVQITDMDSSPEGFKDWLNREFSGWNFTAAWIAGKPASSRIPFMFILADNSNARTQVETLKKRGVRGPLLLFEFQE